MTIRGDCILGCLLDMLEFAESTILAFVFSFVSLSGLSSVCFLFFRENMLSISFYHSEIQHCFSLTPFSALNFVQELSSLICSLNFLKQETVHYQDLQILSLFFTKLILKSAKAS